MELAGDVGVEVPPAATRSAAKVEIDGLILERERRRAGDRAAARRGGDEREPAGPPAPEPAAAPKPEPASPPAPPAGASSSAAPTDAQLGFLADLEGELGIVDEAPPRTRREASAKIARLRVEVTRRRASDLELARCEGHVEGKNRQAKRALRAVLREARHDLDFDEPDDPVNVGGHSRVDDVMAEVRRRQRAALDAPSVGCLHGPVACDECIRRRDEGGKS